MKGKKMRRLRLEKEAQRKSREMDGKDDVIADRRGYSVQPFIIYTV
jgi:hypothetical protein